MKRVESRRVIQLRVRELAKQQGLSDLELAHQAQVDVRIMHRMFVNHWRPMLLGQIVKVAEALHVSTSELIGE